MVTLNKITTRTGDDGTTGLGDGSRLPKDHPLIAALGAVDEANSCLGVVALEKLPTAIAAAISGIQNDLFDLGADLASPPGGAHEAKIPRISEAQVERLDALIATGNAILPPLNSFVLPGGSRASAMLHLARTVARRAECAVVAAVKARPELNARCQLYLNRLSDLLFVWSRQCNTGKDILWVPGERR